MKRGLQIAAACIVVLIGAFAVGSAVAGPFFWYSCSLDGLDAHGPARASIILASDGTHLGLLGATGNRQPVSIQRINPVMRKAIVDTEDRRFYSNNGIDYIGIVRALRSDVSSGGYAQGALDDRAAAGAQPLPHSPAVAQPQAHRGLPRGPARPAVEQGPHPHDLPQRHLLRPGGVRDRGRGRGVLRRACQGSLARAGGAPRRAAAGAVGVRPAQPAGRRESAPGGGVTGDAPGRRHLPCALPTGASQPARPAPASDPRPRRPDVPRPTTSPTSS